MSDTKYWIALGPVNGITPNVFGPYDSFKQAEEAGGNLKMPGKFTIFDGNGEEVGYVEVTAPMATVTRVPSEK